MNKEKIGAIKFVTINPEFMIISKQEFHSMTEKLQKLGEKISELQKKLKENGIKT